MREWRLLDRIVLGAAWAAGLGLCLVTGAIVVYMGVRGFQYLRPDLLVTRPQIAEDGSVSGGILDPLIGTVVLTAIGLAVALPLGVCCAAWIIEYGRPSWFARLVESAIEIVAGTPDIVIAIVGIAVFQLGVLAPLSSRSPTGVVTGTSFIAAGLTMSLIALPPIYAATRDGLQAVPAHMREAAFALGKTRIATIRRVLIPSVRSNIATGTTLGISRIVGDTAIVVIVLGETLRNEPLNSTPIFGLPARHGLDADQLRVRQLAGRRRQGRGQGVRSRVRAAAVRSSPQRRRRAHQPPASTLQRRRAKISALTKTRFPTNLISSMENMTMNSRGVFVGSVAAECRVARIRLGRMWSRRCARSCSTASRQQSPRHKSASRSVKRWRPRARSACAWTM